MVDIRNGIAVDVVKVERVEAGLVTISGYTHQFDETGRGLPLVESHEETVGSVFDMRGRLLDGPTGTRVVVTKRLKSRFDIRPATPEEISVNLSLSDSLIFDGTP